MYQKYFSCLFYILIITLILTSAEDHAKRINDIINKRVSEAQAGHSYTSNIANDAKIRFENHLSETRERNKEIKAKVKNHEIDNKHSTKILSDKLDERKLMNTDDTHKMKSTLKAHGVSDSLVKEINNMVTSYIPKEKIVEHVQTHFPNKDPHEWNDIVIAATSITGNKQADSLDFKKSNQQDIQNNQKKFEKSKKTMEYLKDSVDK